VYVSATIIAAGFAFQLKSGRTSAPVGLQELEYRVRYLAELNVTSAQLVGDIQGHVTGPALGGVERHDADGMTILVAHKVADQRFSVSVFRVGLAPTTPSPAEVIEHEIGVLIGPVGHN
jgi:hypothetical protein